MKRTYEKNEVGPGAILKLDARGIFEPLFPCDWEKARTRFPNPIPRWRTKHATACNVELTGRTVHYRGGDWVVRARITWVGDGEPDTHSGGWVLTDASGEPKLIDESRWEVKLIDGREVSR